MHRFFVSAIVTILLTHGGLRAEECATTLKDTDNYAQLSKIMGCLYGKIRNLEAEVQALKTQRPATTAPSATAPADAPGLIQDNAWFSVSTGGFSRNGSTVSFILTMQNKTDNEIYLGWEDTSLLLTDENGVSTAKQQSNLPSVVRHQTRQSDYAVIGPGASRQVSVNFNDDGIRGSMLVLGANIVQLDGDKHHYYSINWRVTLPNK